MATGWPTRAQVGDALESARIPPIKCGRSRHLRSIVFSRLCSLALGPPAAAGGGGRA